MEDQRNNTVAIFSLLVLLLVSVTLMIVLGWGIASESSIITGIIGAALAVVIVVGSFSLVYPETLQSRATERTLRIASSTLDHMRNGLTPDSCLAVCKLLLPETHADAISMTDTKRVLAYVGENAGSVTSGSPIGEYTKNVLQTNKLQTFQYSRPEILQLQNKRTDSNTKHEIMTTGIIAPLTVQKKSVGAIIFYFKHGSDIDRTQIAIARGLANLLSTQLTSYELDLQAELTARAEVKALQAQINPHFLFNTLNTIAALIRTDPMQARELLREFASFYRQTLESSQQLIPLSRELEQTRRYLTFEYARFGKDRIVETEHIQPGLENLMVPGFIIQPIVENAVRHGMRDEGPIRIDIHAVVDGDDVLIAVTDDGVGMDEETRKCLVEYHPMEHRSGEHGSGMALHNVGERVKRFFGPGSGLEVVSQVNRGTQVALRLAGVAKTLDLSKQ